MNILTFDIEDWFHILDNPETKSHSQWDSFESRLDRNLDLILRVMHEHQQKATFFCVGWIAEKYPAAIRRIVDQGHEIGSHTYYHQLVYEQNREQFETDLVHSIRILEDSSGQKVKYFRAPGFSITPETPWAFEALIKSGIEVDCSVFPAQRAHGGFAAFGTAEPVWIEIKGMRLKEFPINTAQVFGKPLVFSGGGYFRLLPYSVIKKFTKKSDYVMTYFHPRDFDADQPMVPGLNMVRKFKSYYGLKHTEKKLVSWMKDFEFIGLQEAESRIDWANTRVIRLNE